MWQVKMSKVKPFGSERPIIQLEFMNGSNFVYQTIEVNPSTTQDWLQAYVKDKIAYLEATDLVFDGLLEGAVTPKDLGK